MISLFRRKKLQEDKIALMYTEQFLKAIDDGFPEVAALINESPEFIICPDIKPSDNDRFLLVTLSANLIAVDRFFEAHDRHLVTRSILETISESCDVEYAALNNAVVKNQAFISKVNHPSKNLVYGISRATFYKYELAAFQDEYFKNVNAPNPIFIKRLDEAVRHFLWDWETIQG
jgi:hypothetical protein